MAGCSRAKPAFTVSEGKEHLAGGDIERKKYRGIVKPCLDGRNGWKGKRKVFEDVCADEEKDWK